MKAAVFDCEACGLIANSGINVEKQPRLIEFYGCLIEDDGTLLKELYFLCNPEMKIPKETTNITGIDDSMVAGQPVFSTRLPELEDFFFEAEVAVGHNLYYDQSVMNFELQRAKVKPELFWPDILVCTVEATEHLKGYRLSLSALHEYLFNANFTGAHRSKADVQATVRCYVELLKRGVI